MENKRRNVYIISKEQLWQWLWALQVAVTR